METPSEVDLLLSVSRPSPPRDDHGPPKRRRSQRRPKTKPVGDATDASRGLDREIQQMADVADQLVTTLEKTVEELRRRAGVPPYDPANA